MRLPRPFVAVTRLLGPLWLSLCLVSVAHAQSTQWSLCGTPQIVEADFEPPGGDDGPIDIDADSVRFDPAGISELKGNVTLRRQGQELSARELKFDHAERKVRADVDVNFSQQGLIVSAPQAELDLDTNEAEFRDAQYSYAPRHASGSAKRVRHESDGLIVLEKATYTNCDPGDPDWLLSAGKVKLDREAGTGSARNGLLRFKGMPLIYVPWIQFPIDGKRHSGFLAPSFGTTSTSGAEAEIPYYWNIAPNQDATLAPRYLARRGVQAKTEYRFLTSRMRGEADLEYLDDRVFQDARAFIAANAWLQLTPRARLLADYKEVSDDSYFEDLGDSLATTSTTHLWRHADLTYFGGPWNLLVRTENYQTVDRTIVDVDKPYARVPQVLFNGYWPGLRLGLDYGLSGEWVRFERDNSVTGNRVDLSVELSRPFSHASYFFTPTAEIKHTSYSLDNAADIDAEPQRTLPLFSVDSGLIFERDYARGNLIQTLEPRLFYLYVPFRQQSDIPDFDTGRLDFDFSQLFRTERFSGRDRVGDASQLTVGLTSRLIDFDNGQELVSASAGQIFYFRDRRVTLPGVAVETDSTSDLAGQLSLRLGERWTGIGSLLWDPGIARTKRGTAQLVYRADGDHIVNLAYRLRQDELEQTDFALVWPLSSRWSVLGRWNYSVRDSRNLEILGGLEYESCCYKVRLAARRFVTDTQGDFNDTYFLQFVFKGLSQLGSPLDKLLERGILGYTAND